MISYSSVGSNDIEKALGFYDTVLGELGGKRGFATDRFFTYTNGAGPMFAVCQPFDDQPATVGNGCMIALAAPDTATVDKVHAAAMAAGGSDEGAPGERFPGFYGAYFRDLDGNKVACVHISM